MKKFTREEIAQQLRDCGTSLDSGYGEQFSYYIHINEETGEFENGLGDGVASFECPAPYVDEISERTAEENPDDEDKEMQQFWDEVLECEEDLNSPFGEVVDDLTKQINEYFNEIEK